jgi:NADH-quinone oxidoreductase subunit M
MQPHLLTVITFLPLLGVPALLFLRSEDHTWIKRIALAVSLAEFVISLFLIRGFVTANPGYQFEEIHPWIGAAIRYHMAWMESAFFL